MDTIKRLCGTTSMRLAAVAGFLAVFAAPGGWPQDLPGDRQAPAPLDGPDVPDIRAVVALAELEAGTRHAEHPRIVKALEELESILADETSRVPDGRETFVLSFGLMAIVEANANGRYDRLIDITGSEEHASVIRQNNVIMIGLDPQVAFGGADPLVKARFVAGSPDEAIARLREGRSCIVPDHFLRAANLNLGDRFSLVPPNSPSKHVEYTIVGAVSLPGWHWMTKFSGLRRREGRSAAIVFADYAAVRRDFELHEISFFWMNVDQHFGRKHVEEVRQTEKKKQAEAAVAVSDPTPRLPSPMTVDLVIDAKRAAVVKIGEALQLIADRNMGEAQPVNMQGTWSVGATMFGQSVRISTPDEVGVRILARASGMIWASCYLPLITLVVTSLGVANTVMASVRARRWEFGVLRSQGVTRSGLFRMILAEGLLIGLITCLLSLAFGVFSGWCGTGISQYVSFFGGLAPPLVLPWPQLAFGFSVTLALCLAAALWPAISTGRAEPLRLLQEGRAAL